MRPPGPPSLDSSQRAADYNEVKALSARCRRSSSAPAESNAATRSSAIAGVIWMGEMTVSDPMNPVPSYGGNVCCTGYVVRAGAFDQRMMETRDEILVHTSEPFNEGVEVSLPILRTGVPSGPVSVRSRGSGLEVHLWEACGLAAQERAGSPAQGPVEPGAEVAALDADGSYAVDGAGGEDYADVDSGLEHGDVG
jgi:hypothetical protein